MTIKHDSRSRRADTRGCERPRFYAKPLAIPATGSQCCPGGREPQRGTLNRSVDEIYMPDAEDYTGLIGASV